MSEEIKEIIEHIKTYPEKMYCLSEKEKIIMLDYITNLQQELQKANDTIKELRDNNALDLVKISINSQYINTQNENIRLRQENETLKAKLEIGKTCGFCPYYDYKSRCEKANDFIDNYDVFKEFSFPLMKRDIENQIKSSIDYEFNSTFRKKLKNILNGSDEK